jgi:hypothetical protein
MTVEALVQGAVLRRRLAREVLESLAERILQVDAAIARRCAVLHVRDARPERDALIGATVLTHASTVVARNTADFEPTGVAQLNPRLAS